MLVPIQKDDFELVSSWLADPEDHFKVCGNAFSYPLKREVFDSFFVENAGDPEVRLCFKYCVDERAVGMVHFTRIDRQNDFGHIGVAAVDPAARSGGYGRAMFAAILRKGFAELNFHRIDLNVFESNPRALKFYQEAFGFKVEGLARDTIKKDGDYLGWYTLSLLRPEWRVQQ
ncbi:GNAT family N-acetyltransferase [Pseudidiomarina sp. 1APP75-27a]|uniref:GNAT family N-acetyltransferase n=1 Tax=Pseudidiomarina terrestris TaxID=2820060 RepID=UPI002B054F36|nr:GNAT family protein [Pseudidiomarina sp. 1APP75-27a]MEA3587318.1 GNAT family N-acetyltransferase [Pseudidiomarina sp. 1APP75-27a]